MADENKTLTALDLEYNNKQRAYAQAREINRGLTRLKKISTRPELIKKVTPDIDKTGNFIVVPIGELQAKNIEEALSEADKCRSDPPVKTKLAKKKTWFKWGSK
jgi:hypothetical protein